VHPPEVFINLCEGWFGSNVEVCFFRVCGVDYSLYCHRYVVLVVRETLGYWLGAKLTTGVMRRSEHAKRTDHISLH